MSANIQFIETGNLLSPDKGDMSGFLAPPCIVRCGGGRLASCRWPAGGGCPGRVPAIRGQVLFMTLFGAAVFFRRVSCGRQRALGRTLFWQWYLSAPQIQLWCWHCAPYKCSYYYYLVRLSVPVVSVHRGDSAQVWDFFLSDHWGGNYEIWTEERSELVVIASVACFVIRTVWLSVILAALACGLWKLWVCGGFDSVSAFFCVTSVFLRKR